MTQEIVLPTSTLRLSCSCKLSNMNRYLLGTLNLESLYQATFAIDIPRHLLNVEVRNSVIPILKALKTPFLILRGASSHPFPEIDMDRPVYDSFLRNSRTVVLLLRWGVSETKLSKAAQNLFALYPDATLSPYTRVVRVATHEWDAMRVETVVDGREPGETVITETAEDCLLYLYRKFSSSENARNPLALESSIFNFWAESVTQTGIAPFPDTWFYSDQRIHCATLGVFHRPGTMQVVESCSLIGPSLLSESQRELLEFVSVEEMTEHPEFIGSSLRNHEVLHALLDGDVVEPRMVEVA